MLDSIPVPACAPLLLALDEARQGGESSSSIRRMEPFSRTTHGNHPEASRGLKSAKSVIPRR